MENQIICGDCLKEQLPPSSIDLLFTSPPYAEQRKKQYQSIIEEDYPYWTTDWVQALSPALKPIASVVIVIRSHVHQGFISPYILKTRLALHDIGWREPEELIWVKPDAPPLGNIHRPRRSWEHILWFSRSNKPFCDLRAHDGISNRIGFQSKKGVGDWKSGCSPVKTGTPRTRDYFEAGTSSCDRSPNNTHPAQFPEILATQMIKMLCPVNGVVLDPFFGSGTTGVSCVKNERSFIGIDISEEYCKIASDRINHALRQK